MSRIGLTLGPDTPYEDVIAILNEVINRVDDEQNPFILRDNDGVARFMQGRMPDDTNGTRVSKDGVDVTTADDTDLQFSSSFPITRVIAQGEFNNHTVFDGGSVRVKLASHGLNITPFFLVVYSTDNTNFFAPRTGTRGSDVQVGIDTDGSQIGAFIENNSGSDQDVSFKYFIYSVGF